MSAAKRSNGLVKTLLILMGVVALGMFIAVGLLWESDGTSDELVMDTGPLVESDPATFTGNSKPIDIEPMEGIRISAAPNALDRDRTFKVREATRAEWKQAEQIVPAYGGRPFLVLDIDAGMGPQEILPGVYNVDIDLEELGVPEELWDRIGVFRVAGEGAQQSSLKAGRWAFVLVNNLVL